MGKSSKKKSAATNPEDTNKKVQEQDDPDMPEDLRAYKEKLERETGKKYKYRAPKKDLPSIGDMLAYGAPGDEDRPRTWLELIGYPALLVFLFCLSLYAFWKVNPIENSKYRRGRFSLPKQSKPPIMTGGATGNTPEKSTGAAGGSDPEKSSEL
eukprot:scaffold20763_cov175-Amphora_coffeaeformis.AAC.1